MEIIEKRWLGACGLSCHTCPIHLRSEKVLAYFKSRNVHPGPGGVRRVPIVAGRPALVGGLSDPGLLRPSERSRVLLGV